MKNSILQIENRISFRIVFIRIKTKIARKLNKKTKIRTVEGLSIKMQAIEVGHRLEEGDQLILGDTAVLEFSYFGEEK